jgi:hypothetical protein
VSNVIIGIIGVILFIGLALAGASYVGQLVTDGTTQRDATIAMTSLQQTATAVRLYAIRNHRWLQNGMNAVDVMVNNGVLATRPNNPITRSNFPIVVDVNGGLTSDRPAYVIMYLGQDESARDACIEIEMQHGNVDRTDPTVMQQTIPFVNRANKQKGGCARMPGAFGGVNGGATGDYMAWAPT